MAEKITYEDIVGLNIKKPDEGEVMRVYNNRRLKMKSGRSEYENDWDVCDAQVDAPVDYDNRGRLNINCPTSQNIIEVHVGRQSGKIQFNIEPDGNQADVNELQPAKFILDYYLEEGDFYQEKRQFELDKANYGTAIFYNGITHLVEELYEYKEGEKVEDDDTFWNTSAIQGTIMEKWSFTPKNVPIRNFWIDEKAIYQPFFKYARDCIMQEEISLEELHIRRGKNKFFKHIDEVSTTGNTDPAYGRTSNATDKVVIHYYYNRITKDYWIIANRTTPIFIGKQLYKHHQLPFSMAQHYPKNNCIYGRGIPRKIRYIQAYKSQTMQNAADRMQMSSGFNIGIGNNGEVAGELYTSPGEINLWRFTESLQNVQQYQLDGNITPMVNLLNVIDDFIIQDTGDNLKAPYESPASTLGEVEIMEENKQIRQKAIDEARDICLDDALTQSLATIQQFAPKLQSKVCKDEEGKVTKVEFPTIIIPNVTIEKDGKYKDYITDYGNYGYFEFRPDTISSPLRVRVTTASTKTSLQALAKNSFTQFITNLTTLAPVYPQILESYPVEKLKQLMDLTYGYDDAMVAETRKDKIKAENLELTDGVRTLLGLQGNTNEQALAGLQQQNGQTNQTPSQPALPQAGPQAGGTPNTQGGDLGQVPPTL